MKIRTLLITFVSLFALGALSACGIGGGSVGPSSSGGTGSSAGGGSGPVTVNDLPAYPGATELKPGDSKIADTLAKNSQQISALTQSAGAGGKTEQKGFTLPNDATWDAVKKFYDDKLASAGWSQQGGTVANILAQVNSQNESFQIAIYMRGNQNLSVMRIMTDPTTKEETLIFSLTTH